MTARDIARISMANDHISFSKQQTLSKAYLSLEEKYNNLLERSKGMVLIPKDNLDISWIEDDL